jgi:hypothetical protein
MLHGYGVYMYVTRVVTDGETKLKLVKELGTTQAMYLLLELVHLTIL